MPIRFRCLACRKLLSCAACLAGKHILCPECKANLVVPAEEAGGGILPESAALPLEPGPHDLPEPFGRRFSNAVWAVGVLVLLVALTATLGMVLREPDSDEKLARQQPGESTPSTLDPLNPLPEIDELPEVGATDSILALPGIASDGMTEGPRSANDQEKLELERGKIASTETRAPEPKPVEGAGAPAAPPPSAMAKVDPTISARKSASSIRERWTAKRRSRLTDIELRQQLLVPVEVDLEAVPGTTKRLISQSPKAAASGVDLIPRLSATRADLIGLPLNPGGLTRMSTEEALNLKVLSPRLRLSIQNSIPGASENVVDARPDHELLRRQLLNTPQQSLWLRPQAISTLRQLLMPEHKNVRLVLVDLLSNIDGRLASMILAERAVFDLDADVRVAALVALSNRPAAEYESSLVAGLRYPWPAMADHAAEALVVLNLKSAIPKLMTLLDNRDLGEPYALNVNLSKRAVVPELVRINHLRNCLLCHSYSTSPADPVRGLVPHAEHTVPLPVAGVQIETKGWGGGGGGRPTVNVVTSTFVRADVTFLRQDFSIVQPVAKHGRLWPADQRFDYLIRLRPLSSAELTSWQGKLDAYRNSAPQTESLMYALRELTGENLGTTAAEWKRFYSPITGRRYDKPLEPGDEIIRLRDSLIAAGPRDQAKRLALFSEKTGAVYDLALARAIPELPTELQKAARSVLADRLFCMPVSALAEKLGDKDEELRRAGVTVGKQRKLKALTPELIAMLDDSNPEIAGQAHRLLQQFSSKDLGPRRGADRDARQSAMTAWRDWWEQETQRLTARKGASQ
jgi:hypothetical protein